MGMSLVIEALGYGAAVLTTVAFLPQVLRSLRTRSVRDLSLAMLLTQGSGNALWCAYAVAVASVPLVLANVLTFALVAVLAVMKLRERPLPVA
jgi:MtN3 and saliva related transmembrane protein